MSETSLQQLHAPGGICFGCGPANSKGLQIASFADGDALICDWTPEAHHAAFPGVLNGGIIGALLDCHCNWMAAWAIMKDQAAEQLPCTVTADFAVQLKRPTPAEDPVHLRAWIVELEGKKARVESTLESGGVVCATCTGTFIAVGPGHPAYHRW